MLEVNARDNSNCPLGILFPTGGTGDSGETSSSGAILVSVAQVGASTSDLCSRIFSVVSYSVIVISCSSCEGE